jgi:hypothetical protein
LVAPYAAPPTSPTPAQADDAAAAPCGHSGRESAHQEERRPHVAREHLVERGDVELAGGAEQRDPSVVDQDVDVANLVSQALDVGGVAEVRGDEAGLAARCCDLPDGLGAARGVAAVNQYLGPVAGELESDRATDARRRAGYERPLSGEVFLTDRRHCCSFVSLDDQAPTRDRFCP